MSRLQSSFNFDLGWKSTVAYSVLLIYRSQAGLVLHPCRVESCVGHYLPSVNDDGTETRETWEYFS
jgi:hypothetical protein